MRVCGARTPDGSRLTVQRMGGRWLGGTGFIADGVGEAPVGQVVRLSFGKFLSPNATRRRVSR